MILHTQKAEECQDWEELCEELGIEIGVSDKDSESEDSSKTEESESEQSSKTEESKSEQSSKTEESKSEQSSKTEKRK